MGKILVSGLLSGIAIFIVAMAASVIFSSLSGVSFADLAGMRSIGDPVMLLFFLYPFVIGFAMAYAYGLMGDKFKGGIVGKGTGFGIAMWLICSIPSAFIVFSSMDYPLGFTLNSVVGTLAYMVAGGIATAWISEKK